MAVTVGSVIIHMGVDTAGMTKFSRAADVAARDSARIRAAGVKAGNGLAQSFTSAGQAAAAFNGHLGGLGARARAVGQIFSSVNVTAAAAGAAIAAAAVGMAAFVRSADKMKRMENDLRTVTTSYSNLRDVQQGLFEVSQRSRAGMEGTVKIYARTARATEDLGLKQKQLLRLTETVQKSFAVGGASPQEAMGAAIQLSQGIASNRFSGEEYRSVSENAPVLLRAMAKSLGVNLGELRKMAYAGELTAATVTRAILDSSDAIDEAFNKTTVTVGQGMERLFNAMDQYAYETDKTYGITDKFAGSLSFIAENFDTIADSVKYATAAVAAFMGGKIAGAVISRGNKGLFAGTRSAAQAQIKELTKAIDDFDEQREAIEKKIADTEISKNNRLIEKRAAYGNALTSARMNEAAAYDKVNGLVKDRVGLTNKLSQAQATVLANLRKERDGYREAVKLQKDAMKAAAAQPFKSKGAAADIAVQARELKKLEEAQQRYAQSQKVVDAARKGRFDTAALQQYQNLTKSIYADMDKNTAAQIKAQDALTKAREKYVSVQKMGPEFQKKAVAEYEAANTRLVALRTQHADYVKSIKAANEGLVTARKNITVMGAAMSRLKGFGSGLFNLLGGAPGIALSGGILALGLMADAAAKAAARTKKLQAEMVELGVVSQETIDSINGVSKSLDEMKFDEVRVKLAEINSEMEHMAKGQGFFEKLFNFDPNNLGNIKEQLELMIPAFGTGAEEGVAKQLLNIIQDLETGSGSAKVLLAELDEIGKKDISIPTQKLIQRLRIAIDIYKGMGLLRDEANEQAIKLGDTKQLDDAKKKVDDLRQSIVDILHGGVEEGTSFIGDKTMADAETLMKAFEGDKISADALDTALADLAERGGAFKKLYDALAPFIQQLRVARGELEKLNKEVEASGAGSRDIPENAWRGKSSKAFKSYNDFMSDRDQASKMDAETKAIEKRAEAIQKAAKKEGTWVGIIEARAQAEKEIANERQVNITEGMKDLRLDALAGQMDEWNQKIVKQARSLGVTRKEVEAYINAVTSGDLSKVPQVFKDIAAAMEQASQNSLIKTLRDLNIDHSIQGFSDFDKQLIAIARSSGMASSELEKVVAAIRSGDSDALSDTLRNIREQLQEIAEDQTLKDLQFQLDQLGRTDADQRVAERLRGLYGDDYQTHMNGAIAGQIRYNDEIKKTGDLAKDAFDTLIGALTSSGDLTENLISAFAQLGRQFAKLGADKLFDYMTGKSSSLSGLSNIGGGNSVANARVSGTAIGETIAPPITKSLNNSLLSFGAAIRKIESGSYEGNYSAVGQVVKSGMYAGDRAYGAYQIMGGNIASWTKEVLGTSMSIKEFLGNQAAQDKVAYAKMGDAFDKFGNWSDAASVWFSGGPLAANSNRSDGYTSVPSYVSQTNEAMANYPGGLKSAISDGMVNANRRIVQNGNLQQNVYDTSGPSVANGGMTKMQGLMGVAGAGIGAFAGGYESGSPIMGAINGAMAGVGAMPALAALGVAGPVGIIGGAIIGLIGGLIGKSKQKKKELQQAQQELESQLGAITNLIRTATGNYLGAMEKQFNDTTDEFQKAIQMANKAHNSKLAKELKQARDEFFDKLVNDWNKQFQGALDSLNSGLGLDGEFLKGNDAVEKMRESLVGFVNDAKFFAEANGSLKTALKARNKGLGYGNEERLYNAADTYEVLHGSRKDGHYQTKENSFVDGYKEVGAQLVALGFQSFTKEGAQLYTSLTALKDAAEKAGFAIDDQNKVTVVLNETIVDAVEKAQKAAQASALASLSGGKAFSDIEKAIQRLQGAAAGLPDLLEDLGMNAEEAAKAIEFHLNLALRDLRNGLASDIQNSINQLSGFDFLNDFLAAQMSYEARVKDLKALGMDTGLAMQELGLRLSNIAHEADLTDEQLKQLASVFPQLGSSLLGLIGGSLGTPQQALDDAKAKVEEAKSALRESFEKEISTVEQAKSAHEDYIKSIQKFLSDLKLDDQLSPLDPTQRFQEARQNYLDITQKALAGDTDAIGKVEDVSRQYLEEARAYYGTSEGYFAIFNEVESTLSQVLSTGQSHLTELEQQLSALEGLRDTALGTTDAVLSVKDAIDQLSAATAAQAAAQQAYDAAQQAAFQQMMQLLQKTGQAYDPFITSLYRDVLGRSPDAEGAAYYTNMLNSGMSEADIRAKFIANAQPELDRGYATPAYASGGFHYGGLRLVGERGPELEATGASRIWNASETARMLSQSMRTPSFTAGNDNSASELAREVKALREQNGQLLEKLIAVSASGAQANVTATSETTQAVKEQTNAARRKQYERRYG
jgi:tape measure domain-containing protein